ncbi:MAG: VapC toxin family PIN domain ribonuclease [Verrucomicrobia bacterium]|nr:VapC toxin family PIN domain ribonuclease [Verrucomicrobiota bacterium]
MNYLLDVNVLVAWGWADHAEHRRAAAWIGEMKAARGVKLVTSAIPEVGFVRVSVQRTVGRLPVAEAAKVLSGMLSSLGKRHLFLPDDCSASTGWPGWCVAAASTTDAHLVTLAERHGCRLATLDEGIPNAFLIPVRLG